MPTNTPRVPKINPRSLKRIKAIARKHRLNEQVVLDRVLEDCLEMYLGHCTVTCGFCCMRESSDG